MNDARVTLEGEHVRLEPLAMSHHAALWEVGSDPAIFKWMRLVMQKPDDMRAFVESAMKERDAGLAIPFATVEKQSGRAVGSTRFFNFDHDNRRAEIGWTWIAPPWQRTAVNTEAKLLMLAHAFETMKCLRVEFRTDALNERSRAAILRLGATFEGVFRKHMIMPGGRLRDTAIFSILDDEWPAVKARLQLKLAEAKLAGK
jgi:RimJ/RimL family protein N-acetyltransferase